MAVRDNNGNWTPESLEFYKEIENTLEPILKSWSDSNLTLEDMFYIVVNVLHCFVIDETLGW